MPTASPGNDQSTHHIVLSDGSTSVGLLICDSSGTPNPLAMTREDIPGNSLRIYSGAMKHHDRGSVMEPIAALDWSGGRGSSDFDKDTAKYGDGFCVDTTKPGRILLGPFAAYASGIRSAPSSWEYRRANGQALLSRRAILDPAGNTRVAHAFTPTATFTPAYIYLYLRYTSDAPGNMVVSIQSDSGGSPSGTAIYSKTVTPSDVPLYYTWMPVRLALSGSGALTAGTKYWVVAEVTTASFDILNTVTSFTGSEFKYYSGGAWGGNFGAKLYARVAPAEASIQGHFFDYKGSTFCATRNADGTVSKLYINGDQGVCNGASAATTLVDVNKVWTGDEWTGCIVRLVRGPGSDQARPWRKITGNAADYLSVDSPWDIVPVTAQTEYAIVASDKWSAITTGWVAQVVTDVLSVNGAVYFAHGDATALTRMVRYNNAGTWTTTFTTETGAYTYLEQATEQAGAFVYGAKAGTPAVVARAAVSDWTAGTGGAALTFGSAINIGNLDDRITGLERYGDYGNLHVMKRSGIYQLIDGRPYLYNARAMEQTSDYRNGRAVLAYDTFLYYSWHNSLLRYFRGMLDRIGPDRDDEPLPYNRTGPIMALTGYNNIVYAAIDGGPSGYSSIMAYNGTGWSEVYRAPATGMRIWSLNIQPIDGDAVDRLWFTCGADIMWLPLSVDPLNHPYATYNFYAYAPGGLLTSAWMYNELNEVLKYWHTVEVQDSGYYTDNVALLYQTGSGYATLAGVKSSTVNEFAIDATDKRLRVLVALSTPALSSTPEINAVIVEAIKRLPKSYSTTFMYRMADEDVDLLGNPDEYTTALGKWNALSAMEEATAPVTISSMIKTLDGKKAFIETNGQRPYQILLADGSEAYLVQLQLIEVT